ncbi:hypothetical protein MIR68_000486 [Amoeboaphelidium protococcarum]|nr:hypothetical protein MIR68_000486 [Amoeboaphelidium protococcarum]
MIRTALRKPETAIIIGIMGLAVSLSTFHLVKLGLDPHSRYAKTIEDREWEKKMPSKYLQVRWSDLVQKKKDAESDKQ